MYIQGIIVYFFGVQFMYIQGIIIHFLVYNLINDINHTMILTAHVIKIRSTLYVYIYVCKYM